MEIIDGFLRAVEGIIQSSGFLSLPWQNYVMIGVSIVLIYLAVKKQYEPLLLLPIAFGMLLVNLYPDIMAAQQTTLMTAEECIAAKGSTAGYATTIVDGITYYDVPTNGGLLYYLYQGVKLGIYPPLIFLGIGTMTDFGPLIANPKSFILGAAAQIGIFVTFIGAIFLGFTDAQAGAIGIIGGADGPTAIFVTTKLAPELLGSIAIAAYSYMALVPIIQPPIMKALTTKKERSVVMEQLRPVSKLEKIIFPIIVTIIIALLLPDAAPLVGMLMLGNLFKESGVVERIAKTAQNELMNIITIFLGTTVGATATGTNFLNPNTLKIIVLGLIAFCFGTAFGVLFGKIMYKLTGGKVNPLIGSA
ncbi:MAG: sodium ion-translocating decarboxylase subunit beta, partial [bacterium]|nr:sodium ion-translocating decarboxylase subunit beta [bacterium]